LQVVFIAGRVRVSVKLIAVSTAAGSSLNMSEALIAH
jgi:hypothetical protein